MATFFYNGNGAQGLGDGSSSADASGSSVDAIAALVVALKLPREHLPSLQRKLLVNRSPVLALFRSVILSRLPRPIALTAPLPPR